MKEVGFRCVELRGEHFWGDRIETRAEMVEVYLGNIVDSVPDHCNKAGIAIKQVKRIFSQCL